MAGLPDLTKKMWEEIWRGDFEETPEFRMKSTIKSSQKCIQENHNAKTSFGTIIPISLKNNHRLSTRRASYLKYEPQCQSMQDNLIQATKDINKYIISRNDEWNAYTMPSQEKIIIIRKIQENTQNILCKITRWSQPLLKYHWRMDKYHQLKILEAKCHSLSCNGHYIGNNEYKPPEHFPTITSVHLPPLPAHPFF